MAEPAPLPLARAPAPRPEPAAAIRALAMLCLVCFALYAPGLAAIPPIDRDEARFAQATRQMLETGDFVRIRFQDEARNKKPVGIYWLQAASVRLFGSAAGTAIWPYRLPSALAAALAVLLTWRFGARLFEEAGGRAAFAGAVLLACSLGVVAEAHLAKTDAALLAATVVAQGALGLVYVRARARQGVPRGIAYLFWIAEAAAILLKGPPGPLVAVLTAAALSVADRDYRWLRKLRPLSGLALAAGCIAPWLVAIETATGGRFVGEALGHDLLPKLIGAQEAHGAPPGYYLGLSLVSFWPGSLFLVPAAVWGWRMRRAPAERFLLAWLVPAWICFELVPTKLPHYVLPLYPALALLAGRAMATGPTVAGRARLADAVVRVAWALVTIGLAAALVEAPIAFGGRPLVGAIGAAVFIVAVAAGLRFAGTRPVLLAAVAFLWVLPATLVLPRLDALWLSRGAATLVASHPPPPGRPLVAVGYSEPSLVFLLGTATRMLPSSDAAAAVAGGGAALVADRDDAGFRAALAARGARAEDLGHVAGLDYSDGRRLVLTLYDVRPH